LPKITYREAFSLSKLMDVPELVQEQRLVEALGGVEEDGAPKSDARGVRGSETPPADPQGKSTHAKACLEKLRILLRQFPR
jgi:hypothetical protein